MRINGLESRLHLIVLGLIALGLIVFVESALAGQWKPLCIEGSSCNVPYNLSLGYKFLEPGGYRQGYRPKQPEATGPLTTSEGFLLHHTPYELPVLDPGGERFVVRHVMLLSKSGLEDFGGEFGSVTDANSVQLPNGKGMSFALGNGIEWLSPDGEKTTFSWVPPTYILNLSSVTGPPLVMGNVVYIGRHFNNAGLDLYASYDNGNTWAPNRVNIDIGSDRFNLLASPDNHALWGIKTSVYLTPAGLYESYDQGVNFLQVDDGSFPLSAIRIIHDPNNTLTSYAISNDGLYVSFNRGVSWQPTSLTEPVHGLAFAARTAPLKRALVVGTDTGVKVSVDEAQTWLDMSGGLLEIPHTVTYAHDMLIATSEVGYFTCNRIDCAGLSQTTEPVEDSGLVEVVEFYNVNLKHYFMTSSEDEIKLIADGLAGAGWIRTGESFLAWGLGSNAAASNVCRFYGSMNPGPNSHFYSLAMNECRSLMNLQETQPATQPRWNFEQWAFSVIPPVKEIDQPCEENLIPVYRAYNNGYARGEDSNHRYVTDPELLKPLLDDGWSEEGVVFCSPVESD